MPVFRPYERSFWKSLFQLGSKVTKPPNSEQLHHCRSGSTYTLLAKKNVKFPDVKSPFITHDECVFAVLGILAAGQRRQEDKQQESLEGIENQLFLDLKSVTAQFPSSTESIKPCSKETFCDTELQGRIFSEVPKRIPRFPAFASLATIFITISVGSVNIFALVSYLRAHF